VDLRRPLIAVAVLWLSDGHSLRWPCCGSQTATQCGGRAVALRRPLIAVVVLWISDGHSVRWPCCGSQTATQCGGRAVALGRPLSAVAVLWLSDGHSLRRPVFDPRLAHVSFLLHEVTLGDISRPSPAPFHQQTCSFRLTLTIQA